MERSVSKPQLQDLSSCSRICGTVGGLKQGSTSTTLVTKASWIIVQRWYFAGPRLNHVRDVSLGTKVVTEKEQLAQHEEKQQIHRFSPFFLLLLLSFFFFSFFSFFLQGPKSFVWYYDYPKKIKLLHTAPSNSDLTILLIQQMRKSLRRLWSARNEFCCKVRSVGKKTTSTFQIVFKLPSRTSYGSVVAKTQQRCIWWWWISWWPKRDRTQNSKGIDTKTSSSTQPMQPKTQQAVTKQH